MRCICNKYTHIYVCVWYIYIYCIYICIYMNIHIYIYVLTILTYNIYIYLLTRSLEYDLFTMYLIEVIFVSVKYDNSQIWDVRSCVAPFDRQNICLYKETQIYNISGEYVFTSTFTYIYIYIYTYTFTDTNTFISYILLMQKSCTSWYGKSPFFTTGFVPSQVVGLGISAINSIFWYQIYIYSIPEVCQQIESLFLICPT